MPESITSENEKQKHQKPPLNRRRITGEILAGAVAGFAVALPLALLIGRILVDKGVCFEEISIFIIFAITFPLLYGLASATSVYLVGTRGKQTGSFLLTSIGGFLGGFLMLVMLPLALFLSNSSNMFHTFLILS